MNSDLEKRIAYFKKCSKILISRKLHDPDFKAMTIPDKVSPLGCAWRFYSGPDPASPYEGSNWKLIKNGTDTNCTTAELDSDLAYETCPPGSSGSPDVSEQERRRQEEEQQRQEEERQRQEDERQRQEVQERVEKERLQKEKLERERQERVKQRLAKVQGQKDQDKQDQSKQAQDKQAQDKQAQGQDPSEEDDDPTANVPMGRVAVSLSGRSFFINYDKAARARRKTIFTSSGSSSTTKLTDEEEELLETVGIVDETRDSLKTYLPDFFNALPSCQNTTTMMTSRKCEIAYYVMWSVLLKARQDVQRKIDDARVANLPDREVYQLEARLNAISNIKGDGSKSSNTAVAISNLAKQSHDEHAELEKVLKRIDGKIDVIKTNVNVLKARP